MASRERLIKNESGQIFIPMNIDGGVIEENFVDSGRVAILIILIFTAVVSCVWVSGWYTGWVAKALGYFVIFLISQWIFRYLVLQERYLYKIYQKIQKHSITTPAIFWDIASIKETEDGAILIYSDMKIGVILKLERDTIIGKSEDFKEKHYDALADFYKELNMRGYKSVQMNIMETVGKDPRIQELDNLIHTEQNKNLAALLDAQISYIKQITGATLSENDYFLIYTDNMQKVDVIIQDVIDCMVHLLDGAFIGFKILDRDGTLALLREIYGVKYFDAVSATLNVYKDIKAAVKVPFIIQEVELTNGKVIELDVVEQNKLREMTIKIKQKEIDINDIDIFKIINKKEILKSDKPREKELKIISKTSKKTDLENFLFGIKNTVKKETEKITQTFKKNTKQTKSPEDTQSNTKKDEEYIDFGN